MVYNKLYVDGEIWIATHTQQLYQLKEKRENNQCMQETDFTWKTLE